jgi:transcriptional regulator with XRE-family HTH domain
LTHEQFATVEEQLRAALQQTGLSHHELARRSGVSQPVLSRFIRGERTLTLPVVNKLCEMLGLHLCRDDEISTPAVPSAGNRAGKGKPAAPAPPPAEDLEQQGKAQPGEGKEARKRKGQ